MTPYMCTVTPMTMPEDHKRLSGYEQKYAHGISLKLHGVKTINKQIIKAALKVKPTPAGSRVTLIAGQDSFTAWGTLGEMNGKPAVQEKDVHVIAFDDNLRVNQDKKGQNIFNPLNADVANTADAAGTGQMVFS